MAGPMRPRGRPAAQQAAPAGRKGRTGAADVGRAAPKDEAPPPACGAFHAQGLSPQKAEALRAKAHAVLDAQLQARLGRLGDRSRVSIDELEQTVCECMREVGGSLLGGLLEPDSWRTALEEAAQWPCPSCGRPGRRVRSAEGKALDEEATLQTRAGPVPWRAPVFQCDRCRRRFSPR